MVLLFLASLVLVKGLANSNSFGESSLPLIRGKKKNGRLSSIYLYFKNAFLASASDLDVIPKLLFLVPVESFSIIERTT